MMLRRRSCLRNQGDKAEALYKQGRRDRDVDACRRMSVAILNCDGFDGFITSTVSFGGKNENVNFTTLWL